jgi:hypothetical protein
MIIPAIQGFWVHLWEKLADREINRGIVSPASTLHKYRLSGNGGFFR